MAYQAVEEIQNRCEKESIPFWKAVQLEDCEEHLHRRYVNLLFTERRTDLRNTSWSVLVANDQRITFSAEIDFNSVKIADTDPTSADRIRLNDHPSSISIFHNHSGRIRMCIF